MNYHKNNNMIQHQFNKIKAAKHNDWMLGTKLNSNQAIKNSHWLRSMQSWSRNPEPVRNEMDQKKTQWFQCAVSILKSNKQS